MKRLKGIERAKFATEQMIAHNDLGTELAREIEPYIALGYQNTRHLLEYPKLMGLLGVFVTAGCKGDPARMARAGAAIGERPDAAAMFYGSGLAAGYALALRDRMKQYREREA